MKTLLWLPMLLGLAAGLPYPFVAHPQAAPKPPRPAFTEKEKKAANTAASATYLSQKEKDVVLFLNLARMYPQKYREVFLYGKDTVRLMRDPDLASLMRVLLEIPPRKPFKCSQRVWEMAKEQALVWAHKAPDAPKEEGQGISMLIGVAAQFDENEVGPSSGGLVPEVFMFASCGVYGEKAPAVVVMHLLMDDDDRRKANRRRLLGNLYTTMGVAVVPDYKWGQLYVVQLAGRHQWKGF